MRPRVFPAEDGERAAILVRAVGASMRPRVFPAEDAPGRQQVFDRSSRFNEAAGIPRGRRRERTHGPGHAGASMRPRVFPAEDTKGRGSACGAITASMRPRVFPAEDVNVLVGHVLGFIDPSVLGFNEAAGIPRGRRLFPMTR